MKRAYALAAIGLGILSATGASLTLWSLGKTARRVSEVREMSSAVADEIFSETRAAVLVQEQGFVAGDVTLPRQGDDAIVFQLRNGKTARVLESRVRADRGEIVGGTVVYATADGARMWTREKSGTGVEEWLLATQRKGRAISEWAIEGARFDARGEEIFVVDDQGQAQLTVSAPRAFDHHGRSVATRLRIRDGALALYTDAQEGERVLVDPLWSTAVAMGTARRGAVATATVDGNVLVVGGEDAGGAPLASATQLLVSRGTWGVVSPPALARTLSTLVTLNNGKALLIGGQVAGGARTASCELFDSFSGWSTTGSLANARDSHTATVLPSGDVLVVGGVDDGGAVLASAERYSVALGTWSTVGSLTTARARHAATLRSDGSVLVTGGDDGTNALASTERFVGSAFLAGPSMSTARSEHSATLRYDGRIVVAGGRTGAFVPLADVEILDAGASAFSPLPSLSSARYRHSAQLMPSGNLAFAGGVGGGGALATAELLGPSLTFTALPSLATARSRAASILLHTGKLLLAGGQGAGSPLASVEMLDEALSPGLGHWTRPTGGVPSRRMFANAITLADGRILVAGGVHYGINDYMGGCSIFDPSTETWAPTGPLVQPRAYGAMVRLNDNRIMYYGGASDWSNITADIYDPTTGVWTPTLTQPYPTQQLSTQAVLLDDGRVLGVTGSIIITKRGDIYDPSTNTWSTTGAMPLGTQEGVLIAIPGGALLIGGRTSFGFGYTNTVLRYTTATNSWALATSLITARSPGGSVVLLDPDHVLVAGGASVLNLNSTAVETDLASVEVYQISTNTWSFRNAMPSVRGYFSLLKMPAGDYLAIGGSSSPANNRIYQPKPWRYNPGTDTWTILPGAMSFAHENIEGNNSELRAPTVVALPNGDALVIGGNAFSSTLLSSRLGPSSRIDRFRGATGLVEQTGFLPSWTHDRAYVQGVSLRDGRLLVMSGGINGNPGFMRTPYADFYDPVTQTWSEAPTMGYGGAYNAATLLNDGRVLFVAGGEISEVFDPQTNVWTMFPGIGMTPRLSTLKGRLSVLHDGRVFNSTLSPGIYDPSNNVSTFAATVPGVVASGAAQTETAPVLPSGDLFVPYSGGSQIWRVGTGSWVSAGGPTFAASSPIAVPLPSAKFLVGSGRNLYDVGSSTWTTPGNDPSFLTRSGYVDWTAQLPSGRVLMGGQQTTADLFDWQTERYTSVTGAEARAGGTALRMSNGQVLIVGGFITTNTSRKTIDTMIYTELPPSSTVARPILQAVTPSSDIRGATFTLSGLQLTGITDLTCPVITLAREDSGWRETGIVKTYSSTSITFTTSATTQPGPYRVWVTANGVSSSSLPIVIERGLGSGCASGAVCESGYCVDGVCCDSLCNGGACDSCARSGGASADGVCTILPATQMCRAQAGSCDVADFCDGTSGACPSDVRIATGTQCRATTGQCDVAESCDGGVECPVDLFVPGGTECRASVDLCDAAEACTGASALCPPDSASVLGAVCRPASTACDAAETCDGVSFACPIDLVGPAGVECRAVRGPCDVADVCDGISALCPTDQVVSAGLLCRAATGLCDVAESCNGTSALCPIDKAAPAGALCRGAVGDCDLAESCNGVSTQCPPDTVRASNAVCRASQGTCDRIEHCDGATALCPVDAFVIAGTTCRVAQGICDLAEQCSGSSAACPDNVFKSAAQICRASAGACDVAENCSGTSGLCPADLFAPPSTQCRASAGDCDVAEKCSGNSSTCPADALAPTTTVCRASLGGCDPQESCSGASSTCPVDQVNPPGTLCRGAVGACDVAEICTGAPQCPADVVRPSGTICRSVFGPCDVAESCDGAQGVCPSDAFKPSGTECRAVSDLCDVAEACDGASAMCPDDRYKLKGETCRPSVAMCDVVEVCSGESLSCPNDGGSAERPTILHDANTRAAVGIPYRYNVDRRVNVSGPRPETFFRRCENVTLPRNFVVDAQTGLVAWTPSAAVPTPLCVAIETGCGFDEYHFTVDVAASAPGAPIASFAFAPASPAIQTRVDFDGSASRPYDSSIALYAYDWQFGDSVFAQGVTSAHAYAQGGAYTTRLNVVDAYGSSGLFYDVVPVVDPYCETLPSVAISTQPLIAFGTTQVTHTCDCENVNWFDWDLGDGKMSQDASPTHEYSPGRYRVRLIGSISPGCVGQDAVNLEVRTRDGLIPPLCDASVSASAGPVPLNVHFKGLWADPNDDGQVTSATWTLDDEERTTFTTPEFDYTFTTPGRYRALLVVVGAAGLACRQVVEIDAQSPSGETFPRFLSKPNLIAACGEAYRYDAAHEDIPTLRGRSPSIAFSTGQRNADGDVEGVVEGLVVDRINGKVTWTPPKGASGKTRVILAAQNGAGRAIQDFEVDVRCDAAPANGCGCNLGSSPERPSPLWLLLALALVAWKKGTPFTLSRIRTRSKDTDGVSKSPRR